MIPDSGEVDRLVDEPVEISGFLHIDAGTVEDVENRAHFPTLHPQAVDVRNRWCTARVSGIL
jgi:hypothetical protein